MPATGENVELTGNDTGKADEVCVPRRKMSVLLGEREVGAVQRI